MRHTFHTTSYAQLYHPFDSCVGYELIDSLVAESSLLLNVWKAEIQPRLTHHRLIHHAYDVLTSFGIHHQDFLGVPWKSSTLVYACSTCFDRDLMCQIAKKALRELVPGTPIITLSKRLPTLEDVGEKLGRKITLIHTMRLPTSYHSATCYVQLVTASHSPLAV